MSEQCEGGIYTHTIWDFHTGDPTKLKCKIDCEQGNIWIAVEGYGDANSTLGHGFPIKIEYYEGELRVLLWGDIHNQEPTVAYSMEGARESEHKADGRDC